MNEINDDISVPGQAVLPALLEIMQIESARLKKPEQEAFCWEYVTNGGNGGKAYQATISCDCDKLRAQKNASALLKKTEISGRITEISGIIQRKYEQEVIAYRVKGLTLDRKSLVDKDGKIKTLNDMTDDQRSIVDLEVRWVDGALRTIPVIASRDKSADALQKMFAMNKDSLTLTGKGGGPVEFSVAGLMREVIDSSRDIVQEP